MGKRLKVAGLILEPAGGGAVSAGVHDTELKYAFGAAFWMSVAKVVGTALPQVPPVEDCVNA